MQPCIQQHQVVQLMELMKVFDSEILNIGDTYQFTFTEQGNYDYYCILHPWMIGTVNVE